MDLNKIPETYMRAIKKAVTLLKKEGCKSVYLFGSLVTGNIHEDSDIDIGITGLPKGKFFDVYSSLYFSLDRSIDLVNFDANFDFYSMLEKTGELVQIG